MPKKTIEQQQSAQRVGILGETIVQAFLLGVADFCYQTQFGHPADLIVEFGNNTLYKVQVKTRNLGAKGKYSFPIEHHRKISETHKHYHIDLFAFVFLPSRNILFKANTSTQKYFIFDKKVIQEGMEIESLQTALEQLSSIPIISNLLD